MSMVWSTVYRVSNLQAWAFLLTVISPPLWGPRSIRCQTSSYWSPSADAVFGRIPPPGDWYTSVLCHCAGPRTPDTPGSPQTKTTAQTHTTQNRCPTCSVGTSPRSVNIKLTCTRAHCVADWGIKLTCTRSHCVADWGIKAWISQKKISNLSWVFTFLLFKQSKVEQNFRLKSKFLFKFQILI
jgi:hypothetical protein